MIEINNEYYNYPVTITDEDFQNVSGISLTDELNTEQTTEIQDWLNAAHENVYNEIYKIGGKAIKDRIINNNIDQLRNVLKRCLFAELKYMLDANGDYGVIDGSNVNADGQLNIMDKKQIIPKILAPKVTEILKSTKPNLLLGSDV